jgi:hypothetical protein
VTELQTGSTARQGRHRTATWISIAACAVILISAAFPVAHIMRSAPTTTNSTQTMRYLGMYERDMSSSYAGVTAFTTATGAKLHG